MLRVITVAFISFGAVGLLPLAPGDAESAESADSRSVERVTAPETLEEMQQRLREALHRDGEHSPNTIDPLLDIAWWLASEERYAEGIDYLEQARAVATRNDDLSGIEDIDLVRRLSLVKTHYANWLGSLREYRHALRFLDEAERDLANAFGSDHSFLIAPLVSRAFLYRGRGYKLKESGRALTRAIEIAWGSDDITPREIVDLYAREGDFYVINGKPERGWRSYRRAWKLWAKDADDNSQAELLFAEPEILSIVPYVQAVRMPSGKVDRMIEIEGEIKVGRDGKVKSVRILTPDIDPSIARSAKHTFFHSVFRPAMRDGKVVEVPAHRIKSEFRLIRP